ncbi:kelch-like protein 2 [Acyrthosiphon pisum]|uniref:Kelch-like protein diablo n=1 Tax=Acyrthosiphon pisum TaxID=7029 RepID=A0A8R2NJJ5_ACYPI|nr:kelch-like protein 2 [Acyrthosiphon pisum]
MVSGDIGHVLRHSNPGINIQFTMQNTRLITEFRRCKPVKSYKKSSFVDIYEVLQSLRNDEVFCDVKLVTEDDNNIIFAHKVVLASASPYFHAMFTKFAERNLDLVVIRDINPTALLLLVKFIYSGQIMITEENVQILFSTSNFLQLEEVFESVIRWVKHELDSRKCVLPQLMKYVRLPLISKNYILDKVVEEPLIKNCFKCKDFINEALNFQILKAEEYCGIPQNIRHKPRYGDKVILVVGGMNTDASKSIEWYDPKTDQWQYGPEMITSPEGAGLALVKDNLVFAVGGFDKDDYESLRSVAVLDVSSESPCWKPMVDMIVKRQYPVVGVIKDYLYAVGGFNNVDGDVYSAEMFDYNTQEWHMISGLPSIRSYFGGAVLNNLLYVVGGCGQSLQDLDTVECYDPSLDTWKPVAKMSVCRSGVGVGVLDGVLYAVGGHDGFNHLSSVEAYRPSTGVWTSITDMHLPRRYAGVVTLDGLLYVVGGYDYSSFLYSTECYNPQTNSWTIVTALMNDERIQSGVVAINRPRHFTTC